MGSNQVTGHEEKKDKWTRGILKDSINLRVYRAQQQSTNLAIVVEYFIEPTTKERVKATRAAAVVSIR